MGAKKAVFIDRDGTITKDVPFCSRPEDLELVDGAAQSIKKLNDAGFLVIMITDQSGIGRGYFTEDTLNKIHKKMKQDLAKKGARVDGIYYCPHHPDDNCDCRKPKTGLIKKALQDFDISLSGSYVIGDRPRDVELAERIGGIPIKVDNLSSDGISFNDAVTRIFKNEK